MRIWPDILAEFETQRHGALDAWFLRFVLESQGFICIWYNPIDYLKSEKYQQINISYLKLFTDIHWTVKSTYITQSNYLLSYFKIKDKRKVQGVS